MAHAGGRPYKEISQKQFESLCHIQCTEEEICSVLDVCHDTLEDWCKRTYNMSFSQVFPIKKAGGRASLRRNQWKLSETNPTMAIWLGKQMLGQTDKVAVEAVDSKVNDVVNALNRIANGNSES